MGNSVEVEVECIGTAKLVLASGHFFGSKRMFLYLLLERTLSLSLFWTKMDTFFYIGNGMVIIYNNSVVVSSGTLCDGLYIIDLMHSLSYFSFSASFVNVVIVSKCSRKIETSSMLWYRRLNHISKPRIEKLID